MILNNHILSDKCKEIGEMEDEFQLMYLASIIDDDTLISSKLSEKFPMLENRI